MKKVAFLLLFFIGSYHTYSQQTDLDNEGSPADPVAKMAAVNNLKISDWKPGGMNEEYLSAENYNIIIEALCRNKLEEYKDPRYTYNAEVLTTLPKNGLKKDLDVYYFKDANENYIVYIQLSNNANEFLKVTEQVSKILTGRKYDPFCSYLVTGFTMNKTNDRLKWPSINIKLMHSGRWFCSLLYNAPGRSLHRSRANLCLQQVHPKTPIIVYCRSKLFFCRMSLQPLQMWKTSGK